MAALKVFWDIHTRSLKASRYSRSRMRCYSNATATSKISLVSFVLAQRRSTDAGGDQQQYGVACTSPRAVACCPFTVLARVAEQILEPDGDELPVPAVLVVPRLSSEDMC